MRMPTCRVLGLVRAATSPRAIISRTAGMATCVVAALAMTLVGCANEPKPAPSPAPPLVSAESIESRIVAADAAKASGDYSAALEMFREILAENPTVGSAYVGIGEVYVAQGNYVDAEP